MFNIENIINDLKENVSLEDRETNLNIQGKNVHVYSSDFRWVYRMRNKIQAGIETGQIKNIKWDKYGIIFDMNVRLLTFRTAQSKTEEVEEESGEEDVQL